MSYNPHERLEPTGTCKGSAAGNYLNVPLYLSIPTTVSK